MKNLFEFRDYRKYLMLRLGEPGRRTGEKQKACSALGCHTTYLSQVLSEKIHISLENAEALNDFFHHNEDESSFFMLLVLKERAGTKTLKDRFEREIKKILTERNLIKNRVTASSELSIEDRDRFYSSWIYGALHILASIKDYQSVEDLAKITRQNIPRLKDDLSFMIKTGLIKQMGNKYIMGPAHIHLGSESYSISRHHANWRLHAIQSLHNRKETDLHYSAAVSLSEKDAVLIREKLLKVLEENVRIISDSPAEKACVYNFDFYDLT